MTMTHEHFLIITALAAAITMILAWDRWDR